MTGWRRTAVWLGAALAGLLVAAGLTTAAAQLSNQRVGLSSEPLTAGDELAPAATPDTSATRTAKPRPTRTATPRPRRTASPQPTATAVPTVDDNGGHGSDDSRGDDSRGRRRGRRGDDQLRLPRGGAPGGREASRSSAPSRSRGVSPASSSPAGLRSAGSCSRARRSCSRALSSRSSVMPRAFPARRAVTRAASLSNLTDEIFRNLSLRLPGAWVSTRDGGGMTFKTPVAIAAAVATALGGVAAAAVALPSPSSSPAAMVAAPSATPEVRPETVHRTIHVTRHDRRHGHDERAASSHNAAAATTDDAGHRRRGHGRGRDHAEDD